LLKPPTIISNNPVFRETEPSVVLSSDEKVESLAAPVTLHAPVILLTVRNYSSSNSVQTRHIAIFIARTAILKKICKPFYIPLYKGWVTFWRRQCVSAWTPG